MLNALLTQFMGGGVQSKSILASRLGVSEELLTDMLDNLEMMGYVKKMVQGCEKGHCNNCYMKELCNNKKNIGWKITEKGINWVNKGLKNKNALMFSVG